MGEWVSVGLQFAGTAGGSRRRAVIGIGVASALAALLGMSVSGCSGKAAAPKAVAGSQQPSAWERTLAQVQPDGTVTLSTALSAFSLAVGPIPGAAPPAGAAGPIPSGTLAVSWVLGKWSQLSPAQQQAVRTDLAGASGGNNPAAFVRGSGGAVEAAAVRAATPSPGPNPQLPCLTADSAGATPYRAQLAGIESSIAAHLGRSLGLDVHFAVNTGQLEGNSLMYTWACAGTSTATGAVTGCTIHVNPLALGPGYTDADRSNFLIHEVMHCFLFGKFGLDYNAMPAWYLEGVPTWVMTALGTGDPKSTKYWVSYLDTSGTPLFQRSYDAIGFYAHLAETGTDVWKVIDPIGAAFVAGGNANSAGWNAAGITQQFLDSWGSGYATGRYPGAAWNTTGPNLPPYTDALAQGALNDGGAVTLAAKPASPAIEQVDVNAQVVQFNPGAGASGRISLDGGTDAVLSTAGGALYCTLGSACQCPTGSAGDGTQFTAMASGEHYVTVTGGLKAGSVQAVGMTLADACKKPNKPCLVGSWTGTGLAAQGGITASGGAGASLTVTPGGTFTLVLSGMQPVDFTGQAGTAGSFKYDGQESAVITLPAAGASTGVLTVRQGTLNVGGISVTVHVTSPITFDLGPISVSQYEAQSGGGGDGVGDAPGAGDTYQCQGNALTISVNHIAQQSAQWTFARSGS
jgi:hypothetical protein